ncbi:MAG TPA: serine hydrolase domain-containing protein [Planctomycetota bacterium]|nr:serine hydrolase domain-containing protein [Planctomycetota bacterium]
MLQSCLALALLGLPQQTDGLEQRLARLEAELESRRASLDVAGMAIAVVRGEEVVLARGFGLADVESGRAVTPETIFAIGSTTKAFTAALVGTLVADGTFGWDQPVQEVLPDFVLNVKSDDEGARATFRDLLAHRTGFARADLLWAGGKVEPARVLETIARAEPWTGFREEFVYNNIMFLAAGEACAAVAERPWGELLQARILEPLGMRSTTWTIAAAQADERLAKGYLWDEEKGVFLHQPMRALNTIAPAGALNSNVLDLARWLSLQLGRGEFEGRRVLPEEVLRESWTQQIQIGGGVGYGLGWFLRDWEGHRVVEHGGNIDGFAAQIAFLPDDDLGFALLTNVSATPLQMLSMDLVWESLLGEVSEEREVDPTDRAPYLGRYIANFASFHDAVFEVLEQGGKLAVDVPGQMTFTLKEPDSEGRWVFEITDQVKVTFQRDAQGHVVGLTMLQNGLTFEVPREGVETQAEIDLEDAQRFLGDYKHPAFEKPLAVSIQNQRLAIAIPGQMVCDLHAPDAEGRRVFRVNEKIHVVFDEDSDGSVLGLTFVERGVESDCPRVGEGAETGDHTLTLEALHALRKSDERARAVEALGAWRMQGKLSMVHMGIVGHLTLTAQGPDRQRVHTDLSPYAVIEFAYNRGRVESRTDISEETELTSAQREWMRVDHPASPFGDWRTWYGSIRVVRADERDGKATWIVKLTAAEGIEMTVWVDAATGDTLFEEYDEPLRGALGVLHSVRSYSDFREFEGLRVPYRSTLEDDFTGRTVFELEHLEARMDLAQDAFRLPPP